MVEILEVVVEIALGEMFPTATIFFMQMTFLLLLKKKKGQGDTEVKMLNSDCENQI